MSLQEDLLLPKGEQLPFYTAAEVAEHNTKEDIWVAVDNKVYDITKWIPIHPGGTAPLVYAGKDVTKVFYSIHNKGVLQKHQDFLIGTTLMRQESYDLGDAKAANPDYDAKLDPQGYDTHKAGEAEGKWGSGREFGDLMAKEGQTGHIPMLILLMYVAIFAWGALAHFATGCQWWTMPVFYVFGMVAFLLWHKMAHSDWTGEMHEIHMEHHLIRFPPSDFYGSAELFAQMYPDGQPTIWSLMNIARTTNVANTKHTPLIHEAPLLVMMIIILLGGLYFYSAGTILFVFIMHAVMAIVGNAFHMSFHVRGFHLEKYKWYMELRTLHYIHHLGDMKSNFSMVNMGFDLIFASMSIKDPASKKTAA